VSEKRDYRHGQFQIETQEVCTYDGHPLDEFDKQTLVRMIGELLRDFRKQESKHE
jgi:hypothetical protein